MNLRALRSTLAWVILLAIGCSGGGGAGGCGGGGGGCGGCGGCGGSSGCMTAIPGGFPAAQRIDNAVSAQLTPQAFTFLQQNLQNLVGSLLGSNGLSIACLMDNQTINVSVLGYNISETVPISACCGGSGSCDVQVSFGNLTLDPETAADGSVNLNVDLPLSINTGNIPLSLGLDIPNNIPIIGGDNLCTANCNVNFNQQNIMVKLTVNLKVDPQWGNILAANVTGLDSIPGEINLNDLHIGSAGGICSDAICGIASAGLSVGFIQNALIGAITPTIDGDLQKAIDGFRCQKCDTTQFANNGGCPDTTPASNPPLATCDSATSICYIDKTADTCAPAQLGLQGRVNLGSTLAKFGGSPDTTLDIYDVAGGQASGGHQSTYVDPPPPNGGIVLGLMGGTNSPFPSDCVPPSMAPAITIPTPINFETAASETGLPQIMSWDAAIAISAEYMNKALWDVYNSGAICLDVGTSLTSLLSTGTFSTFLGSLGYLAHGENVPMLVALRPKNAPTITVGLGTTSTNDAGMTAPADPLLSVGMKDLQIDFYAFLEERYVRVFSLTVPNFDLPVSLDFDPGGEAVDAGPGVDAGTTAPSVTPVLGSLSGALAGLTETNCEALDSDDCNFFNNASGLGAILGLVPLGSLIPSISLPSFDGIQLSVDSARGACPEGSTSCVGTASPTGAYQQLALYASLSTTPAMMMRTRTHAEIARSVQSTMGEATGPEHKLSYAVINASADGAPAGDGYQYAYRVNGGFWSTWIDSSEFEVHSPAFIFEGKHTIEVISRANHNSGTKDLHPVSIQFVVDYTPPVVKFQVDHESNQLLTVARDAVWHDELTYSYNVDGTGWTSRSEAPQAFSMLELATHKSVEVEVTDGAGHSTKIAWGVPPQSAAAQVAAIQAAQSSKPAQSGCTQTGTPAAAALLFALLFVNRRRRA